MLVTCLSDLHGYYPDLPEGDLLLICGDLTSHDALFQYGEFIDWLKKQPYRCKVFIGGNHDVILQGYPDVATDLFNEGDNIHYLMDSGVEFEGLKIWGSPWQKKFLGQNKHCMAFSLNNELELKDYFQHIPNETNILMTHTPPYSILDTCTKGRVGSVSLYEKVFKVNPLLHCFGHIHEDGQSKTVRLGTIFFNGAVLDEYYRPRDNIHPLEINHVKK